MQLHYFTLMRQVAYFREKLTGGVIIASYTQRKNEQVMELRTPGGKVLQLQLSADSVFPFILLLQPGKRARNSTDVLPILQDKVIESINLLENDRVISFAFTGTKLRFLVQLFRNQSNFFVVDESKKIVAAFKKEKKFRGVLFELKKKKLLNPLNVTVEDFLHLLEQKPEAPLEFFLKQNYLYLSPVLIREISYRSGIDNQKSTGRISDKQLLHFYREMKIVLQNCGQDSPRIYFDSEFPKLFVLTEFQSLSHLRMETFEETNSALTRFIFSRRKILRIEGKLTRISAALKEKLSQIDQLINHLKNLPGEEEKKRKNREIGELLLSQKHLLKPNQEEVLLTNYFDAEQKQMKVRLNPKLSIPENAEMFFRRAKESSQREKELRSRLKDLGERKEQLERILTKLNGEIKENQLNKIENQLNKIFVLQPVHRELEEISRPYKKFQQGGWEIWVGKNAKANDEMTFRFAHKEDFWLHAQGVSGSHVIVRNPQRFPGLAKEVMEFSGELAVRFSKAKHSKYAPVIITKVKYVRKPRGSAAGAVIVEREKTFFVEVK